MDCFDSFPRIHTLCHTVMLQIDCLIVRLSMQDLFKEVSDFKRYHSFESNFLVDWILSNRQPASLLEPPNRSARQSEQSAVE